LNALQEILTIKNIVNKQLKSTLIFQSVIPSAENIFGNIENYLAETKNKIIDDINEEILSMSEQSDVLFFNIEETAKRVGLANWLDHRMYYWAKLPFNASFYGIYASKLINLIAADKGLTKKALVLDLDNTLWGGVIGDDGVDGIKASVGDPKGESFLNFQEYCKRLKSRGILLAVCSKNTLENALLPFKENPDMVLHEDDFVVFKANWNNKADKFPRR
jgi:HAD superfamily phosphatase (TIGR01681 family)